MLLSKPSPSYLSHLALDKISFTMIPASLPPLHPHPHFQSKDLIESRAEPAMHVSATMNAEYCLL